MPQLVLHNTTETTSVSRQDYGFLRQWRWLRHNRGYAYRPVMVGGKSACIMLHRVVAKRMGLRLRNREVDHIDRNRLNNRRSNLRAVTKSINQHNAGARKDSTTGHRGISWVRRRLTPGVYRVRVQVDHYRYFVGDYATLDAAIHARTKAVKRLLHA